MSSGASARNYGKMTAYQPPEWAKSLKGIPKHRLQLGHLDTPIHKWNLPGTPSGYEIYIKRDDMTGSTLSGNKIRKLEFLLADAVTKGCKHIITCGGLQSNHCRATAIAAAQMGLKTHLVLRTDLKKTEDAGCKGNMFLNRLCGVDIYLAPKFAPYLTHLKPKMKALAQKIKEETGEDAYLICVGGSDAVGFFGYLNAFDELIKQKATEEFTDIVFACGSGGTAEGLAVANFLSGSNLRIHGIAVSDNAKYFYDHTDSLLGELEIGGVTSENILNIIDGYKGKGYGESTQDELDFIVDVSTKTGIMLDPVYTVKAVKGLVNEISHSPQKFKGNKILYLHTGGIFGMYDGRLDEVVTRQRKDTNRVFMMDDIAG